MKRLLFLFSPLLLFFLLPQSGSAQFCPPRSEHPELWTQVQDYLWVCRIVGTGDTVAPEEITASYDFDMVYDTVSQITYTFTECKQNGQRLMLKNWKYRRRVNAHPIMLSFNSGTEPFTVAAGDDISFFRYILWREPHTGLQDTNTYLAFDTLDYAVELVRMGDSARVALIDSIGILPSPQPNRPIVYGHRPLMAIAHYTVPPELDGQSVFLRVLVYHRGAGAHWFTRTDLMPVRNSWWLSDPHFQKYLSIHSPISPKRTIDRFEQVEHKSTVDLEVVSSGVGEVKISFTTPSDPGQTTIGVYDMLGQARFFPYMGRDSGERITIRHVFPESGTYLVVLLHDGHIVESRRVQVVR